MRGYGRFAILVAVLFLLFGAISAGASSVTFTPSGYQNLNGYTQDGFTLSGNWRSYGFDSRNAPLMEFYNESHSLFFNAGTFTFNSMVLGGLPWDNYTMGHSGPQTLFVDFEDINGNLIKQDSISLPFDNTWNTLADNISGVHTIFFPQTGGNISDGGWVYGFWPRLDSINYNGEKAVPEPSSMLLIGTGLVGLAAFSFFRKRATA